MQKTPVVLITGYLGSGKTTLLRKVIEEMKGRKIAVLMNEFGSIGIDGRVLKGKAVEMVELSGGCVCCSLTGEFEAAVKEILEKIKPEYIFVETTGLAEPDTIVGLLQDTIADVRIDSIICIADADSLLRFPTLGHTGRVQIELADIILLNKIDLVPSEKLLEIEHMLRELNPKAEITRTNHCSVSIVYLLGLYTPKEIETHEKEEHIQEEFFSFKSAAVFNREKFESFSSGLPENIFRAKGFIVFPEGGFLFNFVAGRFELEPFPTKATELVFIGGCANSVKESLFDKLKECEEK
ncbi:MAG: GTP-binding protein [Candidatus Aenigmarchaeota archaeon]|nr:GTP-binding protein [Candidatus Aenigmarchaeota archaeon]